MSKLIAVAMAAAIAFPPVAGSEYRPQDLRTDVVYHLLTWQEKSGMCIAAAPIMLHECDGDVDLAMAFVETEEQFALEDGTPVGQTTTSYVGMSQANSVQQQTSDDVGTLVATSVAGSLGWQAGWIIGGLVGQAVVASSGGVWWAAGIGVMAPWLGGAIVAAGVVY